MEILRDAQADWESSSNGSLRLILQEAESKSGNDMIIVHAMHVASKRTASLFSIICRKGHPYPARIRPKDDELPNYLKKTYKTQPISRASVASAMQTLIEEKWVNNPWVSETPSEFRFNLEKVFNLGNIKSEVLNLISSKGAYEDSDSSQPESDEDVGKPDSPLANNDMDVE